MTLNKALWTFWKKGSTAEVRRKQALSILDDEIFRPDAAPHHSGTVYSAHYLTCTYPPAPTDVMKYSVAAARRRRTNIMRDTPALAIAINISSATSQGACILSGVLPIALPAEELSLADLSCCLKWFLGAAGSSSASCSSRSLSSRVMTYIAVGKVYNVREIALKIPRQKFRLAPHFTYL